MKNFFQAVYVVFPEICNGTKIRFHTAGHPFHFKIYFTAFCQFSWGADTLSASININLIKAFRIVRWTAFCCCRFYTVLFYIKMIYKRINDPCNTFFICKCIPWTIHQLIPVKTWNIRHFNSPRNKFFSASIILYLSHRCMIFCVLYSVFNVHFNLYWTLTRAYQSLFL